MKRLPAALCLAIWGTCALAQGVPHMDLTLPLSGTSLAGIGQVINVTDPAYGAKCDDATADDTAINAAIAAAKTWTNTYKEPVTVVGPNDGNHKRCKITSGIDVTGQTTFGDGRGIIIRNLSLHCVGAGVICWDELGSFAINTDGLDILGDTTTSPAIGFQEGAYNPSVYSCCIHANNNLHVWGNFTFAARYNASGESITDTNPIIRNNGASTKGVIMTLGSITAGSSYTAGTYTGVSLTGGTGSGAVATIVVSGSTVASVTLTNQGKGYTAADSLSANASDIGGTGSGFSVPVATIGHFAYVMDGSNHWGVTSSFISPSWTADTYYTFTQNNFFGGSLRYYGSDAGYPLWMGYVQGAKFFHTYILNIASGTPCISWFDNSATNGSLGNSNNYLDIRCETTGVNYEVYLYGSNATPLVRSTTLIDDYSEASTALFGTASNITLVTATNLNVQEQGVYLAGGHLPVFGTPTAWNVTGQFAVSYTGQWDYPRYFHGLVLTTLNSALNYNVLPPMDAYSGFKFGVSCARLLTTSYTGALCQVERTSDSTTLDIYPDSNGNLDEAAFQSFCAGTSCKVKTAYDQSGNTNNCTQTTVASQPVLAYQGSSILGNRPVMTFGDAGAVALPCGTGSTIGNVFTGGGWVGAVGNETGNTTVADRIAWKGGSGNGWDFLFAASAAGAVELLQGASTSGGTWAYNAVGNGNNVYEAYYSNSSLSNVPTLKANGTNAVNNTTTQPVGTITSDSAQTLIIGNSAATGGNRGFPGYMAEVVITGGGQPDTGQAESIRRNQAVYYGLSGSVQ